MFRKKEMWAWKSGKAEEAGCVRCHNKGCRFPGLAWSLCRPLNAPPSLFSLWFGSSSSQPAFSAKEVTECLRVLLCPYQRWTCATAMGNGTAPLLSGATSQPTAQSPRDIAAESSEGEEKARHKARKFYRSHWISRHQQTYLQFFWSKSCCSAALKMQALINSHAYILWCLKDTCFCKWYL